MTTNYLASRSSIALWLSMITALLCSGCAETSLKQKKAVAREWCETIRASQVIPIYPLSEDIRVGDVYLVQSPISKQHDDYERNSYLPLDHLVVRLPITNFSNFYFNGYFKDNFGSTPHDIPLFTNAGPFSVAVPPTRVDAPRVAFPTYSFHARSKAGLGAAFPIEGIPLAFDHLQTQDVDGSIVMSDARTYAGDVAEIRSQLRKWANDKMVRDDLAEIAQATAPTPVYLRVVSRVYLVRGVDVSLHKAGRQNGKVDVGIPTAPADETAANKSNQVSALNALLKQIPQIGGSAQFTTASSNTVGLSQAFDRLLGIGYLGFDTPVYENGTLGAPIPTFRHITLELNDWTRPVLEAWDNNKILRNLATENPKRAFVLMTNITASLRSREFSYVADLLSRQDYSMINPTNIRPLIKQFRIATAQYGVRPNFLRRNPSPQRVIQYNNAFNDALLGRAAFEPAVIATAPRNPTPRE